MNTVSQVGAASASQVWSNEAGSRAEAGSADFASILKAFEEEAHKTPAERAREAVLKRHNLSEDDYQKLPKDEKEQIDREIAEAVRRAMQRKTAAEGVEPPFPRELLS